MENISFFTLAKKKLSTIVLVAVATAALSFVFLIASEKSFKVRTDFLITQNNPNSQDFYAMSRSSEYIGNVLSEALYSDRFIDAVIATGKVQPEFLPLDKNDRIKAWAKEVNVKKNLGLGILQIEVLNNNQKDAIKISQAISDVLTQKNILFRGGDEKSVDVRILSGPIVESNPSITALLLVTVAGFLFGGLMSLFWIFVKEELLPKPTEEQSTIIEF